MASISTLLSNAWNYLRKFNLFQKAKRDDEHEIQNEIISTRLFLFLMAASIIILLVYTSQVKMTLSITHNSPTLELYQSLYEDYGKTLVCPCTNIAIAQKQFISLTRTVHQICRSDFITDKWFSFLNAASTLYISSDFRFTGSLLFQIIASFCHLSDDAIQNGLSKFNASNFVTNNLMDPNSLNEQYQSLINLFISTTASAFANSFEFIRNSTSANGFLSGLSSNFQIGLGNYLPDYPGYRIIFAPKVYNETEKCSCARTPTCTEHAVIQTGNTNETTFIIPGLRIGCLLVEGVRQSSLECFYNQTCINQIQYYLQSSIVPNVTALNSSETSRYNISTTMNQLLANLMVESWLHNISYDSYYYECQPKQCTYTKIQKNEIIVIITTLIGLIGGLYKVLLVFVPFVVKLIRRKKRPTDSINEEDTGQIIFFFFCISTLGICLFVGSFCHKLQILCAKIFQSVRMLNLFPSLPPSTDAYRLKTEVISTRLYLLALIICFLILIVYKAVETNVETIIIKTPSFETYQHLYDEQNETLSCPCSTIASDYKEFLDIKPIFHQLCTSDFVQTEWIYVNMRPPQVISIWDYRLLHPYMFSMISSYCSFMNGIISNSLISFYATQLISPELLPENIFNEKTNQFTSDFILSTKNTFTHQVEFTRTSQEANFLANVMSTNSMFFFIGTYPEFSIYVFSILYGSSVNSADNCICDVTPTCSALSSIFFLNDSTGYFNPLFTIPGIMISCTIDSAVRQSTLECFYNQSCFDTLVYHLNLTEPIHFDILNPNISSIYRRNDTIDDLLKNLMIEEWISNSSYQNYYENCLPSTCSYTKNSKTPLIIIITTLIGLLGGLVKILRIIVPMLVRIVRRRRQQQQQPLQVERPSKIFKMKLIIVYSLLLYRYTSTSSCYLSKWSY